MDMAEIFNRSRRYIANASECVDSHPAKAQAIALIGLLEFVVNMTEEEKLGEHRFW